MRPWFKGFVAGAVAASLLVGAVGFAADVVRTQRQITVTFLPLRYIFDGVEKAPPSDQQGFIYQDRTFVPLRFAAESVGKDVSMDATYTIRVDTPTKFAATVVSVTDGDTIKVSLNGRQESIRLIGADTPETVHPSKPVQPYGPEASAYTKSRLTGQQVVLEFDLQERDRYGRLLAYVWIGEELFNGTLIKEGYGQLLTIAPNVKYVDQFKTLQTEARVAQRGLWGLESAPAPEPEEGEQSFMDRDCGDFKTHAEAQAFFEAEGGPDRDQHGLDKDGNGLACESLR